MDQNADQYREIGRNHDRTPKFLRAGFTSGRGVKVVIRLTPLHADNEFVSDRGNTLLKRQAGSKPGKRPWPQELGD